MGTQQAWRAILPLLQSLWVLALAHKKLSAGILAVAVVGLLAAMLLPSLTGGDETSLANSTPQPTQVPAPVTPLPLPPSSPLLEDVIQRAMPSVVEIRTGTGVGTGFIVHEMGLVVTNEHVVGDEGRVSIRVATGGNYTGTIIGAHPTLDMAFIEIDQGSRFTRCPWGTPMPPALAPVSSPSASPLVQSSVMTPR